MNISAMKISMLVSLSIHAAIFVAPQWSNPQVSLSQVEPQPTTVMLVKHVQPKVQQVTETAKETLQETLKEVFTPKPSLSQQAHADNADPQIVHNQPPVYPRSARRKGFEGTVVVKVQILPTGETSETQIVHSSGYSMLDRSAQQAISKWVFQPATKNGKAISTWVEVPVTFTLKS